MAPARDRRTGFSRRRQYSTFIGYVLAVAGAVVGAVLLVVSTVHPPAFGTARMAVASVTAPIAGVLDAGVDAVASCRARSARGSACMARMRSFAPKLRAAAHC